MNNLEQNFSFLRIMLLVVSLAAVGQITNTIYVPAMTMIANSFAILATHVQSIMAIYLLTYGLSQFIYGPFSDYFGRKPIIIVGLIIFVIGSITTTLATTFQLLFIGSCIQGCGIGCGGVMARTVMRDLYHGPQLHRAASHVSVALIVAPLIAPLLGGILASFWGWRACFAFLILFSICVLIAEYSLFPETNKFAYSTKLSGQRFYNNYLTIFKNYQFLGYMTCLVVTFSGVCIFEAVGGILFSRVLGFSPFITSLWFTLPLPAYMLGSSISGFLAKRWPLKQTLLLGIALLFIGAISLLLTGLLQWINIYAIIIPITLYMFAAGIVFPAATSGALEPFPQLAGTAGALLGGVQNLGAGFAIFISAMFRQTSQLPLGIILSILSFTVLIVFIVIFNDDSAYQTNYRV